jgi:hypothetical protein
MLYQRHNRALGRASNQPVASRSPYGPAFNGQRNKNRTFAVAIGLHAIALIVAALALGAGVIGAHGGFA